MFKHGGVLSIDSPSHGDVFCAIRTCWPSSDAIHPVEMESALVNQCARTRNRSVYKSNEFKVSTKVNVFGTQLVTQWPVSASVMKLCRALAIAYACSLATYAVVCVPFWTYNCCQHVSWRWHVCPAVASFFSSSACSLI